MSEKILWVCSDLPYPPTHGGRVDMWQRIKKASELNYSIDLIVTVKEREQLSDVICSLVDNVYIVNRDTGLRSFLNFKPYQIKSRKLLKRIDLNNKNYNLLVLESEYVYEILNNKTFSHNKISVRIHNNERRYFLGLAKAEKNIFKKIFYIFESFKFLFFSIFFTRKFDNYLFISEKEYRLSDSYLGKSKNKYFHPTPFVDKCNYVEKKKFNVLFISSFFMVNNQEAIFWYLNKVHPQLSQYDDYNFILVGNDKNVSENFFDNLSKYKKVKVFRSPSDLDTFYKESMIFINPMQNGAGVKLKTINAVEFGLPIVSTTVGSEGTNLRPEIDFLLANNPDEFCNSILKLYKNHDLRKSFVFNSKERLAANDTTISQIKQILLD